MMDFYLGTNFGKNSKQSIEMLCGVNHLTIKSSRNEKPKVPLFVCSLGPISQASQRGLSQKLGLAGSWEGSAGDQTHPVLARVTLCEEASSPGQIQAIVYCGVVALSQLPLALSPSPPSSCLSVLVADGT